MPDRRSSVRRRLNASLIGVALGLGVAFTGWIASSAWGIRLDNEVQNAFAAPATSGLFGHAFGITSDVEEVVILVAAVSFVLALLWWGPRRAIVIVVSVALAWALAELLKRLAVVAPPSGTPKAGSSWPSAHASALVALNLSILILPRRQPARWLLGLLASGYLVIVCLSLLVTEAHHLTDLLGGCLIGAWAFTTVAAVFDPWASRLRPRWRVRPGS